MTVETTVTAPGTRDGSVEASRGHIVIAGGGTGGHLFPGIAVAQEIRERLGARVTFVTTDRAQTLEILERDALPYRLIDSQALQGRGVLGRLLALARLPGSVRQAKKVLHQLAPNMVLGMGGYTSGPVGVAAYLLGIPLAIHEQNAILGFTNRWLTRLADRVFLSFPDTVGQVPTDRAVFTGNPIRPDFMAASAAPRPEFPFTLLVMGGSQGARHLNVQMLAALDFLEDCRPQLHVIHLTGPADEEMVRRGYAEKGFAAQVYAFSPEVAGFMQRAHLILCRAGASTLAELTVLGRAAILVPYPYAAHQHQEKNARVLAGAGAALMVQNQELSGERIAALVHSLMTARGTLADMENCSRAWGQPGAAAAIVRECRYLLASGAAVGGDARGEAGRLPAADPEELEGLKELRGMGG